VSTPTDPSRKGITTLTAQQVGVIGLGSMGGAMARTFVRQGWQVLGYDPSGAAQREAQDAGVETVDSSDQLAGTRYVVCSLPSAKVVETTVPGLFRKPGTEVIVDTTTSEPETTRAMVSIAAEHDAHFLDAPVSGGNAGAAAGTLAAFVGGSTNAVTAAGPLLTILTGGKWKHIGPAGSGNVVKLLNNMLASANLLAVAEAMDVAAAYGIDLPATVEALNTASGASLVSQKMFPDWILSGSFDSGFSLGLMARDLALALDIARRAGSSPRLFEQTNTAWQQALDGLGPQADFVSATSTFTTATQALSPDSLQQTTEQ